MAYLVLNFTGTFQSYGTSARSDIRLTESMPTMSAVVGAVSAGLGVLADEHLSLFRNMWAYSFGSLNTLVDYQNAGASYASGSPRNSSSSAGYAKGGNRQLFKHYIVGGKYGIILEVDDSLDVSGLDRPVIPLHLGRKNCIPSDRVFVCVCQSLESAKDAVREEFRGLECNLSNTPSSSGTSVIGKVSVISRNDVPLLLVSGKRYGSRKVCVSREFV